MKKYADLKCTERVFKEWALVCLRLQHYRQMSMAWRRNLKLSPRFYGPFLVVKKIDTVAYHLDLPAGSCIHHVFHVSQLKLKIGRSVSSIAQLPPVNQQGVIEPEPEELLDIRFRKVHNRAVVELLIRWQGQLPVEATWEKYHLLKSSYPHIVGKVF
jgi:hypothetical protein